MVFCTRLWVPGSGLCWMFMLERWSCHRVYLRLGSPDSCRGVTVTQNSASLECKLWNPDHNLTYLSVQRQTRQACWKVEFALAGTGQCILSLQASLHDLATIKAYRRPPPSVKPTTSCFFCLSLPSWWTLTSPHWRPLPLPPWSACLTDWWFNPEWGW